MLEGVYGAADMMDSVTKLSIDSNFDCYNFNSIPSLLFTSSMAISGMHIVTSTP